MQIDRLEDGRVISYAFPGGYPVFYLDGDNNCICPDCANETEKEYKLNILSDICNWCIYPEDDGTFIYGRDLPVACGVNYEDENLFCDACSKQIESAYGEDD